jgi:hypothetical protein
VAGAAIGAEAEQRLVEDLAVAQRADGRVLRRRVEADQCQVSAVSADVGLLLASENQGLQPPESDERWLTRH